VVDGLTVGLAGEGSRDGFGEAVFDDVCELIIFLVFGMEDVEGLRLRFADDRSALKRGFDVDSLISGV
jgi:hypothetical protein